MRYSITASRPDGKTVTLAANEWLEIDIKDGNKIIETLTVKNGEVWNDKGESI